MSWESRWPSWTAQTWHCTQALLNHIALRSGQIRCIFFSKLLDPWQLCIQENARHNIIRYLKYLFFSSKNLLGIQFLLWNTIHPVQHIMAVWNRYNIKIFFSFRCPPLNLTNSSRNSLCYGPLYLTKKTGPSHCKVNLSSQLSLIPPKAALNTFQMTKQTGRVKTTKKERHEK